MQHYTNYQLKKENTFRMNSVAKEIWFPENLSELKQIFLTHPNSVILGGGSNVVLDTVLKHVIGLKNFKKQIYYTNYNSIFCSCSVSLAKVIKFCKHEKLGGLEWGIGIPGQIGGGIYMNVGSGPYSISQYVTKVFTLDKKGVLHIYLNNECNFGRRDSIFQYNDEIIIGVELKLNNNYDIVKENYFILTRKNITKKPSAGGVFKNWHALKPYLNKLIGLQYKNLRVSNSVNIIEAVGEFTLEDFLILIDKIKMVVKDTLILEVKIMRN